MYFITGPGRGNIKGESSPEDPWDVSVAIGVKVPRNEAVECILKIAAWIDAEERRVVELEAHRGERGEGDPPF